MRLEPVAERAPEHAGRGAAGSSLLDVVLAVEEVCGVARVEREGLETREGLEQWFLVQIGTKDPPPKYPGIIDSLFGRD